MLSNVVTLANEAAETEAAINPWAVGGVTLAILIISLFVLLAFAGGREHS